MADVFYADAFRVERLLGPEVRVQQAAIRLGFPCPRCKAQPGEPCRTPRGKAVRVHAPRMDKWIRAQQEAVLQKERDDHAREVEAAIAVGSTHPCCSCAMCKQAIAWLNGRTQKHPFQKRA